MHAFVLYIALFFAFTASPSTQCNGLMRKLNTESSLNLICRKTTNFGFCVIFLRSDPQSEGASIDKLAHIALNKLGDYAKETSVYLQDLQKSCSTPEKVVTQACIRYYGTDIINNVASASKHLDGKDYGGAVKAALGAMIDSAVCQGVIDKNPSPKWEMQRRRNRYSYDVSLLAYDLIRLIGY